MLGLLAPTNAGWIDAANADLASVLVDHMHCEKKAAATALSLINRYADDGALVERLLAMAQEELAHCATVHAVLRARGIGVTHDRGDAYAQQLQSHIRRPDPVRKLDSLLVAAIIEARSCERFTILEIGR